MERAYEGRHKILADGVKGLRGSIINTVPRVPIGLDGAVIENLLMEYSAGKGLVYFDNMRNVVEASSRTGRYDRGKLWDVLGRLDGAGARMFFTVDMRTVTGGLQRMMRELYDDWRDASGSRMRMLSVALFDDDMHADIRVYNHGLAREDRVNWLPSYREVERLFFYDDGRFRSPYGTTHESIGALEDVKKVKLAMA